MTRSSLSLAGRLIRTTGLQLVLVAGSLSALSFTLGRSSGITERESHRANLPVVQVSERLSSKLSYPTIINTLNQEAIAADPTLLNNFDKLSRRFWRQLRSFPVDYINYGATDGSFLGLEKTPDNAIFHNEDSTRFGRGTMLIYSMSNDGKRLARQEAIDGMSEFHEEAWYVDTVKAGQPTWSSIYAWEDQPETFSISYNAPIFNAQKQLLGVVGVDMIINKLSTWLAEAWNQQDGLALIVEANGDVVASSSPGLTFLGRGTTTKRANLKDLSSPLAQELRGQFLPPGTTSQLSAEGLTRQIPSLSSSGGETYLINAVPWGTEYGLNWFLLTAVKADQEISATQRNLALLLGISVVAFGSALLINQRLIRALLTPLSALTKASQSTEQQIQANSEATAELAFENSSSAKGTQEILDLNQAIASMVSAFNKLTHDLKAKELQIIDLFQQQRDKDERELAAMNQKLKTSLEAASIAHEVNQPLSIIRVTSQSLLQANNVQGSESLPEGMTSQLSILNEQSQRIAVITEKIRALLRNAQTSLEPVDLRQVIASSVRYVGSNHRHGDWIDPALTSDLADGQAAVIQGDPVQLQVALINLLKNGLDALAQAGDECSGEPPLVRVSLREQQECWQIDVDDNGPGLPDTTLAEMPLRTSKPDGSGIGLFLVRSAMECHHGTLELQRSQLGGLQARLNLPKQA